MEFDLIIDKNLVARKIILLIWISGIIIGVFLVIYTSKILGILFFLSQLFTIIGGILIKSYKIIGRIHIGSELIRVNFGNSVTTYKITNLTNVRIKSNGAKGDIVGLRNLFGSKNGAGNQIAFSVENKQYQYEFLVIKPDLFKSMFPIFKNWMNNGLNFRLYNQNSDDITSQIMNR